MIQDSTPIILVHLGSRIPTYLKKNIEFLKSTRTNPITIITDRLYQGATRKLGGVNVQDSLNFQEGWQTSLRTDYRSGFWENTKKRLFVLSEYLLSQEELVDVLHIESDVWLSPGVDFSQEVIPSKISFPIFTETRASGSLILVSRDKQRENLERLKRTLLDNHQLTDMESLQVFLKSFPNSGFGLRSNPDQLSDGLVFDAAPLGMHLFGEDPRNKFGYFKQFGDYTYLGFNNLNRKQFYLNENSLFVSSGEVMSEVACLHLHSKSRKLFREDWTKSMERVIRKRIINRGEEINNFSFQGLLRAVWDYLSLVPSYLKRRIL